MKKLLTALTVAALAVTAQAQFQGSTSGSFQNAVGDSGMVGALNPNINGPGGPFSAFEFGTPYGGSLPNKLAFDGAAFGPVGPGDDFGLGTLTYRNGSTTSETTLYSVDLAVKLTFTTPPGVVESFLFPLTITMTPNVGTPQDRADYATLLATTATETFKYMGQNYTLEVGFNPFSADDENGFVVGDEFHVYEGKSATASMWGKITAVPNVPDGGSTLMLLGAASALMGYLRRRM